VVRLDQGGLSRRHTKIVPPPADLSDIVESAFILRDEAARRPSTSWRVVPDPSAHVILVLPAANQRRDVRAVVVGARSSFTDIDVSGRRLTLGVRFRPGALAAFARERATSFTDRAFPAEDVLGRAWRSVGERALERDADEALLALLALLDVLRGTTRGRRQADRTIAAVTQMSSVAEAAESVAMPLRTFHARVRETLGLSPKRLMRILRLYRVLETFRTSPGWAAAAADAGFADQPHLVRELRALLGETPGQWLARGAADSFKTPGSRLSSSAA
jgi:AraC-like DNA-binding protein